MGQNQHRFTLFADYSQFYIACESWLESDDAARWTPQDTALGLSAVPGCLAIATARAMDVPVVITVHAKAAVTDLAAWDHVAEHDITLTTANLIVAGCTDYAPDAARISLAPGLWRARVSFGGLATISDDGLDGDDRYQIDLWPAAPSAPICLKACHPEGPRPL